MRCHLLCLLLLVPVGVPAAPPFPDLDQPGVPPDRAAARADWVRITNLRLEMQGKSQRVALADAGNTAVVFVRGINRAGQARPILLGKGEFAVLIRSMVGLGCNRVVVRNPDTLKEWGARLEPGKKPVPDP